MALPEEQVYRVIGDEGFQRLLAAFYRLVPNDAVLGPLYLQAALVAGEAGDDEAFSRFLVGAEDRLRGFLVFRFGGPETYIQRRGHPRLRARHMPFRVDQRARERWLALMDNAFKEAALPPEAEATLRGFFESTATFLLNT